MHQKSCTISVVISNPDLHGDGTVDYPEFLSWVNSWTMFANWCSLDGALEPNNKSPNQSASKTHQFEIGQYIFNVGLIWAFHKAFWGLFKGFWVT